MAIKVLHMDMLFTKIHLCKIPIKQNLVIVSWCRGSSADTETEHINIYIKIKL